MTGEANKKGILDRLSPFTLILTMVIFMIIGAALIPMIKLSYMPSKSMPGKRISVSFSWSGASARVVEQEVTSRIEGLLGAVSGIETVTSVSGKGYGSVSATLKKGVNVPAVRFEVSSLIKQLSDKLPEGVSYPTVSGGSTKRNFKQRTRTLLSYQINANMQEEQIQDYALKHIQPYLEQIKEIERIHLSGGTSKYMEVAYDPAMLANYGLNADAITEGISAFLGRTRIIGDMEKTETDGDKVRITALLETNKIGNNLQGIPIAETDGKMVYLNDLTHISYKDREAGSYFRINGLNTIYLSIEVDASANFIALSEKIQKRVEEIKTNLPAGYHLQLTSDAAKEIKSELQKLVRRTALSLLILLIFVWAFSRNLRYLSILFVTLLANVLLSFIFYYLFDVELNIFSLAGITVSFGLIIDTSIVMVDHYGYYRNRRVFIAILAALLTTIGSLIIIFFLPDYIQNDLYDFSAIIIINLAVALVISLFFVPALIDKLHFDMKERGRSRPVRRRIIRMSRNYMRYITFTQKRKWIYITLFILAFGLPLYLLPSRVGEPSFYYPGQEKQELEWYHHLYNETVGSNFYQSTLKKPLEYTLGGTIRLFAQSLRQYAPSDRRDAPVLTISVKMPEGGSVVQLNEKVMQMENFLSKFEEISRFTTRVDESGGNISVEFKEEFHGTSKPLFIKNSVISQSLLIGGADWSAYGIDRNGFSNSLNLDYKSHRIRLSGYNYDRLYRYAEELKTRLSRNKRVTDADIEMNDGNYYERMGNDANEMYISYDKEKVSLYGVDLGRSYAALRELLASGEAGSFRDHNGIRTGITLQSVQRDRYDLWHLFNSYISVGDKQIRFSKLGDISKRKASSSIPKRNQEYSLSVAFNFSGSYGQSSRFIENNITETNALLPIGFACENQSFGMNRSESSEYWLLLLIAVILFFICSILFESLRQPLVIVSLIPISFIGTFLTFYFSGVQFGTGGFASLVLLSGLVVNAGIYIINEYNNYIRNSSGNVSSVRIYVKAFNHKIIPVLLTILSTVLGLLPFLIDGKEDQFWFSFAIGTSGGLLFSVIALVFIMPVIMNYNYTKNV